MSSATRPPEASAVASADATARARIRDAALARFGADGVEATSLRAIARDAGVSAPLVVHHFGSKAGLRRACDEHVAATIRAQKLASMEAGAQTDVLATLRQAQVTAPTLMRYLARTLPDGTPEVAALVDELVDDAVAYMEAGVRSGLLTPSDDPRGRATVLTLWSLGALVLNDHLRRLTGADLTGDVATWPGYALPATEILSEPVLAPGFRDQIRDGYRLATTTTSGDGERPPAEHEEPRP